MKHNGQPWTTMDIGQSIDGKVKQRENSDTRGARRFGA